MNKAYDLLIIDVMPPDIDCWQILKTLREAGRKYQVVSTPALLGP